MASGRYAIVWIDQEQARIIFLNENTDGQSGQSSSGVRLHRRAKPRTPLGRRATDEHVFYQKIANDLASAEKFLLMGTAEAKAQFVKHLGRYDRRLMAALSTLDRIDGMTDNEFLEIARAHFQRFQSSADQSAPTPI